MLCGHFSSAQKSRVKTKNLKRYFFTNDPVRVDHLRLDGSITAGVRRKGLQALAGNIAVRSRQKGHRYLLGLLLLLARGDVLEPHEPGDIVFREFFAIARVKTVVLNSI